MSDRRHQLTRIAGLLKSGSNVSLHAGPGAGKTWLADKVGDALAEAGVTVVRVDMSVLASGAHVLLAAAAESRESGGSRQDLRVADSVHDAWRTLTVALSERRDRLVLILDEFDSVLRYSDALDFLRLLREIVHRPRSTNCNALFASRRSLEAIEAEVRGISTLASVCFPEYLGSITSADLAVLWEEGEELEEDEKIACVEWAAGHPSLIQYWLAARPDIHPSDGAEHQQLLVIERVLDHLDLLGLRDAAAQLVLGPIVDEWLRERRQLVVLGVLASTEDEARVTTLGHHGLFQLALRHRTWDLNPWGVLGLAEVRLRGLIEQVLSNELGLDWIERISKGNRAVGNAYAGARDKQQRDDRQFGRAGAWLAYTYPGDLWAIVSAEWGTFSKVFHEGDKQLWRRTFETLAQYRTPLAHNRPESMSEHQRAQCRIFSEDIIRAIDSYEAGQVATLAP